MKRRTALGWPLVLVLAAAVFCALWQAALHDRSDLEDLAQAEAGKAYTCFLDYQEMGYAEDYWGGVAAFSAFQDVYGMLTENTEKATNHITCGRLYGALLAAPEKARAHIPEMIEIMDILFQNITDETAYGKMSALCNALEKS